MSTSLIKKFKNISTTKLRYIHLFIDAIFIYLLVTVTHHEIHSNNKYLKKYTSVL